MTAQILLLEMVEICLKGNFRMFTEVKTCILRAYRASEGPMGSLRAPALVARLQVELESSNWAHFSRGGKHNAYERHLSP